MIPQRIQLRGFLCYKEEQSIEFDGNATLWMLSGLNGSGKSAIFDAVTYALFGHHRGGGTHAYELINKDCDTLAVEFDFLLDGKAYRAKRTLKRDTKGGARGTQQLFWCNGEKWLPIEDTGQKREFDRWIEENIGLSYETFTSSVLLLQGKAERLLDSKPEGRREVLASIVDLGRYERLHAKADEQRKSLEINRKGVLNRLETLPAVEPLELEAARNRISEAEQQRKSAREQIEQLLSLESTVRAWQETRQRLAHVRQRWQKAQAVLSDAAAIEQSVARLRELREVVPRLHEVTVLRQQSQQAEEQIRHYNRERDKLLEQQTQKDAAWKQARQTRTLLQGQITRDTDAHREVTTQLRTLSQQLVTLKEYERQQVEQQRLQEELRQLPSDPQKLVTEARAEFDHLELVERTIPALQRFVSQREAVARSTREVSEVEQQLQQVRQRGETAKADAEQIRPQHLEAERAVQAASEAATTARTLTQQAKQSLEELAQIDGAKLCRHCGQPLTVGHLQDEKRRRTKALQAAEAEEKQANHAHLAARKREAELRERLTKAEKAYSDARVEYGELNSQLKAARSTQERGQRECTAIWNELPADQRTRIAPTPPADWLVTQYPTLADLESLQSVVRGLPAARRKLREAEQVWQLHAKLKAQESQVLESLTRLNRELPNDHAQLRQQAAALEVREKSLFKDIDAKRLQLSEIDKEIEHLHQEREQVRAELARCESKIKEQQLIRDNADRSLANLVKQLPALWQTQANQAGFALIHTLRGEIQQLEAAGTDDRGRDLEQARLQVDTLEHDLRHLEQQEAGFPPEAREDPQAIQARLVEARRADHACDQALSEAQKQLALLENYQAQREQLQQELQSIEKELVIQRTLCELLGKDRLQLYLVRRAERQVVEYANAVLDRLSGGQLYLKLAGEAGGEGSSAKALDLEAYNRSAADRPINVAFLSGSQKFRVAVSLALGIGQYASRRHRPIESVIIDEGFGCLDSQGRQVMIQELQNLRSQMRCILLVSHQEDFAEAFSDGYQFKLENGATRVSRLRK